MRAINRASEAFNRGFDWLSRAYGRTAGFVVHHSPLMILAYLVLIGGTVWLLVVTPKGFIPAQDRGYVVVAVQLPGAASLHRTTEVVKQIEKIALGTPGVVAAPAFAGFSGATRTLSSNAAALFPVFEAPEIRAKQGLTSASIAAELRKRLSVIQSAFIIVIPPPAIPGIGTGGGFTLRVQDRQGRGPELLASATARARRRSLARPAAGRGVLALRRQHAAGPCRDRPHACAETRRADRERQCGDRDLFRIGLRQRLQYPGPHLSRHRAGGSSIPQGHGRSRTAEDQELGRRHGAARQRHGFQGRRRARPGAALQSLSGSRDAG